MEVSKTLCKQLIPNNTDRDIFANKKNDQMNRNRSLCSRSLSIKIKALVYLVEIQYFRIYKEDATNFDDAMGH